VPDRLIKILTQSESYFLDWLKGALRLPEALVQLLFFFSMALLGCHFIACMFIFLARMEEFAPDSWTGRLGLDTSQQAELYVSGLYYILTTLTTVGYGDIVPVTKYERVFCLVIMLFGVFIYSYTIGSLINIMATSNQRRNKLQKRMKTLEDLNKEIKIDKVLLVRLKRALRYDFTQSTHHKQKLFSLLPANLCAELLVLLNQHLVRGVAFFHNRSPAFIARIIQSLRPLYAPKNDRIYQVGDLNDNSKHYSVFFLVTGRVALQHCMANGQFVTLVRVNEGNYFGELDLLFEVKRTELARGEVDSELLSLGRAEFFDVCIDFPEAKDQVLTTARSRLKLVRKLHRLAELVVESCVNFHLPQTFTASENFQDVDEHLDSSPSDSDSEDIPETAPTDSGGKRSSFRNNHLVTRSMNSRSKLALKSDAGLSNNRKAIEVLAVIGELERKVDTLAGRLDQWDGRWNSIEGALSLLLHQRRLGRHATMQPMQGEQPVRRGALLEADLEEEV